VGTPVRVIDERWFSEGRQAWVNKGYILVRDLVPGDLLEWDYLTMVVATCYDPKKKMYRLLLWKLMLTGNYLGTILWGNRQIDWFYFDGDERVSFPL
jgi:hypothetical protein